MKPKHLNPNFTPQLRRNHNLCPNLNLFLTFLLLLLPQAIHAQVVIKEKGEINPQAILGNSPATNAHSVRFEFEWVAVVVPENNHFYNANLNVKTH